MKTLMFCGLWFYTGILCIGIGIIGFLVFDKPFIATPATANAARLHDAAAAYGPWFMLCVGGVYALLGLSRARRDARGINTKGLGGRW